MNIVAFIFARKGSRSIKNKNKKIFLKKPLIYYSILHGKKLNRVKEIIVSTDSLSIKKISERYGAKVPFLRPKKLSSDSSPEIFSWRHACLEYEKYFGKKVDIFLCLPVTTPLRRLKDTKNALIYFCKNLKKINFLISITKTNHFPAFNMVKQNNKKFVRILDNEKKINNRQQIKNIFNISTSFYITTRKHLFSNSKANIFNNKTAGFMVPKINSIDIDDHDDWTISELLANKFNLKQKDYLL
tara:strand:- start:281 stop:1009 length:729 start_codon:yes stop_codon:yes gene_type:complete